MYQGVRGPVDASLPLLTPPSVVSCRMFGPKPKLIGRRYRVGRMIGCGGFGEVHVGTMELIGGDVRLRPVAIKFERLDQVSPQLENECALYRRFSKYDWVPRIHWFDVVDKSEYRALVMDLMGPSVDVRFHIAQRRFSVKTIVQVGLEMLRIIQALHTEGFVHCDIKPDNFVFSRDDRDPRLYLIDLGLAFRYKDASNRHIAYREGLHLTGTPRYASIWNHQGCQISRRDDMVAFVYSLVYLFKHRLPWSGIRVKPKKLKFQRILETKLATSPEDLCKGLPDEMLEMLRHVCSLKFDETPRYDMLEECLRMIALRHEIVLDDKYDWNHEEGIVTASSVRSAVATNDDELPMVVSSRPEQESVDSSPFHASASHSEHIQRTAREPAVFASIYSFHEGGPEDWEECGEMEHGSSNQVVAQPLASDDDDGEALEEMLPGACNS